MYAKVRRRALRGGVTGAGPGWTAGNPDKPNALSADWDCGWSSAGSVGSVNSVNFVHYSPAPSSQEPSRTPYAPYYAGVTSPLATQPPVGGAYETGRTSPGQILAPSSFERDRERDAPEQRRSVVGGA